MMESSFLQTLLQWLNENPNWAGFIIFLISAGESIAILGTIVPGSVMMIVIGTIVGAGVIPLWPSLIWAILGAIAGDGVSYWLGYYFKDRLHYMWPFKRYPQILEKGEVFFKSHGAKSVFVGRFVGPVRAIVPMVAGMFGLDPLRFTVANVASAILWAPSHMLPGILLGAAALELPSDIATHAFLMLLLTLLLIILIVWSIRKILILMSAQINQYLNRIWISLGDSRYFKKITTLLKHYDPAQTHGQLTLAFYVLATLILFVIYASYVSIVGSQNIFVNKIFFYLSRSMRNPTLDNVMIIFTLLGQGVIILPAVALATLYTFFKKQWHTATHILSLLILTPVVCFIVKHLVHSPRPWGDLNVPAEFSFPSGHSLFSATFYIGLGILIVYSAKIKRQWPIFLIMSVIVFLTGISRIYLGVHWFTDVLGSWILASLLLMITILSYNRNREKDPIKTLPFLLVFLTSLVTLYCFYYFTHIHKLRKDYSMIGWPIYSISTDAWWNEKGKHIPLMRLNRLGAANDVLNIQWVGDLNTIKNTLLMNGWEIPPQRTIIGALYRITDVKSTEHLPIVSTLYLDKNPVLVLIKHAAHDTKRLLVLSLWDSNLILVPSTHPLWVGSVEYSPHTFSWLFRTKKHRIPDLTSQYLFNKIPASFDIKTQKVTIKIRKRWQNFSILLIKPKAIQHTPIHNTPIHNKPKTIQKKRTL